MTASALAVLVGVCVLIGTAHATQAGTRNGEIVYQRYRLSDDPLWAELYVTNSAGSAIRRLTLAPRGFVDGAPDWSPDGSRVVFQRCATKAAGEMCAVWIVDADGTDAKRLTPSCAGAPTALCPDDGQPSFTPDGRHVLLVRSTGGERHDSFGNDQIRTSAVLRVDLDGRNAQVLTAMRNFSGDLLTPRLSPDGKQLAYVRWNSVFVPRKNRRAIFVSAADGSGARRITPWRSDLGGRLDWAPDGTRLLYQGGPGATVGRGQGNLFTVRPDGRDVRQLTHFAPGSGVLRLGSYSPDGRSIVFSTSIGASAPARGLPDLFVMAADGTSVRPVTRAPNWDGEPDWGS
jgi:TolB protein